MPSTAAIASISVERGDVLDHRDAGHAASPARPCARETWLRRSVPRASYWQSRAARRGSGRRRRSRAPCPRCRRAARGCPSAPQSSTERMFASPGSPTRTMPAMLEARAAEHHHVDRARAEGRVLLVDHHEVEAQHAQDLGRVRRRRLDERAEQMLARPQAASEVGVGGARRASCAKVPRRFRSGCARARGSSVTASERHGGDEQRYRERAADEGRPVAVGKDQRAAEIGLERIAQHEAEHQRRAPRSRASRSSSPDDAEARP